MHTYTNADFPVVIDIIILFSFIIFVLFKGGKL